ncbi:hypothetical protein HanLR1_Chr01g0015501 [Helianthus annuus]|nr:hypothetical protein HanLR1_Chr01g0015501 [Helianthus annuus]
MASVQGLCYTLFFTDKHKKALFEALEKVKAELMILGFISLILTFTQYYIAEICIPVDVADTMLPCAIKDKAEKKEKGARQLLLWYEHGRSLAGDSKSTCKEGKVPIITVKGLHQLHILIVFLAVLHIAYNAITMAFGRLKTRGWKMWEEETSSHDYEFSNDPSRFRLTHETSFVRAHTRFWTQNPIFFYIFFTDKHKKALFEALEKVKAVDDSGVHLTDIGFYSILHCGKICIPVDVAVADTMLPCAIKDKAEKKEKGARRLLLWYEHGRSLAGDSKSTCKEGKVPIITVKWLHQLHILIFFLAVLHVAYSAISVSQNSWVELFMHG